MDLLGITEMSMQRTWKVSAGEVKLGGMAPDICKLALHLPASLFHITLDFYQGCGSGYFVNHFRFNHFRFNHFRFQQSLDSISSMNLLTSMTIKTSSLRFTRAHY